MTDNKVCTGTTLSNDFISIPSSIASVDVDDDSYYGELYNIIHGTTEVKYPTSDNNATIFGVYAPDSDLISGALNLYLKYESENGLGTPNYMKYILTSDDSITNGTFFANIKGLLTSTNFFATFDDTDEGSTVTNVHYGDLTDTDKNYVQNIYNARNYTSDDEAYDALNAIVYSLNKLIDATIKYNWRANSDGSDGTSSGASDGSDTSVGSDGTSSGASDSIDASIDADTTSVDASIDVSDSVDTSKGVETDEYTLDSNYVLKFTENAQLSTLTKKISDLLPYDYAQVKRIDYTNISDTVMTSTDSTFSLESLYRYCSSLESIEFGNNFDASMATSMYYMFADCPSLKSINLSSVKTSNSLENLQGMC